MKLKSNLLSLMEQRGINQKELAAATGLSPTTIGKICRNHFERIDSNTVMELCRYFSLKRIDDLIELIWEEEDQR